MYWGRFENLKPPFHEDYAHVRRMRICMIFWKDFYKSGVMKQKGQNTHEKGFDKKEKDRSYGKKGCQKPSWKEKDESPVEVNGDLRRQ